MEAEVNAFDIGYCLKAYGPPAEQTDGPSVRSSIKRKLEHSGSDSEFSEDTRAYSDPISVATEYVGSITAGQELKNSAELDCRSKLGFDNFKRIQERSPKASNLSDLECQESSNKNSEPQNGQDTAQNSADFEQHWLNFQNSMINLASKGYRVESLINNAWVQPAVWKLSKSKPLETIEKEGPSLERNLNSTLERAEEHTPSLDDLLLAAEWSSKNPNP
jgi:hypothetical protein